MRSATIVSARNRAALSFTFQARSETTVLTVEASGLPELSRVWAPRFGFKESFTRRMTLTIVPVKPLSNARGAKGVTDCASTCL
jgi:hypothetical protein